MTCDEARLILAEWLERHATDSPDQPHEGYDQVEFAVPRQRDSRWTKVLLALSFWDGWIDASNHDWQYYKPIRRADWPALAREVASALRDDREITNPLVVERFGPMTPG